MKVMKRDGFIIEVETGIFEKYGITSGTICLVKTSGTVAIPVGYAEGYLWFLQPEKDQHKVSCWPDIVDKKTLESRFTITDKCYVEDVILDMVNIDQLNAITGDSSMPSSPPQLQSENHYEQFRKENKITTDTHQLVKLLVASWEGREGTDDETKKRDLAFYTQFFYNRQADNTLFSWQGREETIQEIIDAMNKASIK